MRSLCEEEELVELLPPSERGLCQILAVDGLHEASGEVTKTGW